MQTFLPFPDFTQSAAILDRERLGKQRVENLQIMKALLVENSGWSNHPATKMWQSHEGSLLQYHIAIVHEWSVVREYKDSTYGSAFELYSQVYVSPQQYEPPPWLGDEAFHRSHQANLVRKNPDIYRVYFPEVDPDLPYIWPG